MYTYARIYVCIICGSKRTAYLKVFFAKAAATFHHARVLQILQSRGQLPQDLRFAASKELSCYPARKKTTNGLLKATSTQIFLKFSHDTLREANSDGLGRKSAAIDMTNSLLCK